jgi:uncharacterized protein YbjT (DUF2867 family)
MAPSGDAPSPPSIDRVLVAGATGKTGRRVLAQLADAPVTVRAMTRSQDRVDWLAARGADEVTVGDLLDPAHVRTAVTDVDAVLTCVGSTPLQVWTADEHVDGRGNTNLVEAAAAADVSTVVMLSSLGACGDRGSSQARFFRTVVGPVVAAKSDAERAIRQSGLRYTILRPGLLLSRGPDGATVAEAGTGLWGAVTRGSVARLIAASPFTPAAADRTLEVAGNPFQRAPGLAIDWHLPTD